MLLVDIALIARNNFQLAVGMPSPQVRPRRQFACIEATPAVLQTTTFTWASSESVCCLCHLGEELCPSLSPLTLHAVARPRTCTRRPAMTGYNTGLKPMAGVSEGRHGHTLAPVRLQSKLGGSSNEVNIMKKR